MLHYGSTDTIESRFAGDNELISLTDGDSGIVTSVLTEVGHSAQGEMHGYLARRYDVPIQIAGVSVSATNDADLYQTLQGIWLDLCEYRLRLRAPMHADKRAMYDDAIRWLRDVSKGAIVLPSADSPPDAQQADTPMIVYGNAPTVGSSSRLFSRHSMRGA